MELKDCAFPLLASVRISSDPVLRLRGGGLGHSAGGKAVPPRAIMAGSTCSGRTRRS